MREGGQVAVAGRPVEERVGMRAVLAPWVEVAVPVLMGPGFCPFSAAEELRHGPVRRELHDLFAEDSALLAGVGVQPLAHIDGEVGDGSIRQLREELVFPG